MVGEEDTKHIVGLSLIPVGTIIKTCDGWHGSCLIGICLHSDSGIVTDGQKIVDNLKSMILGWVIHGSDIGDLSVLGSGMALQEGEDWDDGRWSDEDGELILPDAVLLNVLWKTGQKVSAVVVEGFGLSFVLVDWVDNWRLQVVDVYSESAY